jgi:5-methylcytosine-specific restriction endonuclease McrA
MKRCCDCKVDKPEDAFAKMTLICRECKRIRDKAHYQRNRSKILEHNKAYNQANKESVYSASKKYNQEQRAIAAGVEVDISITYQELFDRDGGICQLCFKPVLLVYASMDHKKPLSSGGKHVWDNVQLTHIQCNKEKGVKYG